MFEVLDYQFVQYALIACLMVSLVCGVMGVIVIEKKLIMMSGGIAHTTYGGVGLGYLLGFSPLLGAIGFSVAGAFAVGYANRKGGIASDITISLLWSSGMALGVVFIGFVNGYPPDISSYLFGSILTVTANNLIVMGILSMLVMCLIFVFYNDWKAYLFDEEFAKVQGRPVVLASYMLLVLVALTAVILMRVAGIIMVIALLTAPAASASLVVKTLGRRMIAAIFFGIFYCLAGLALSFVWNIASGATIVLVSVVCYILLSVIKSVLYKVG